MSFLIPSLLWALPAILLPVIIHLISRADTKIVDFSSLQFLRKMQQDSLRRLRLHQWLIILLRTLIMAVLIFMLSRPVVKGYFQGWVGNTSSTLSLIIVDNSFSLRGDSHGGQSSRVEPFLSDIFHDLNTNWAQGRAVVVRTSDARVIYDGRVADLPTARELVSLCLPEYETDALSAVLDSLSLRAFQSETKLYANKELVLIGDFQSHQQAALARLAADTTIWADWHIYQLPVEPLANNLTITDADVITDIPLVGKLMDVRVRIRNNGTESQTDVPVQVVLNDVRSGLLVVDLEPGEEKSVFFRLVPSSAGDQRGYAELERDDRPEDNRFYFHAYIPERVNVVLIEDPKAGPSFVNLALHSLAAESQGIQLSTHSPSDITWSPVETDVIVLNCLSVQSRLLGRQINEFAEAGGSIIAIPFASDEQPGSLQALTQVLGISMQISAPAEFGSPLPLDRRHLRRSILQPAFQREIDSQELPTVTRYYPASIRSSSEAVITASGKPVLVRSPARNGILFTFTVPMNLQWNDLPIHGSFIPLWHRLVFWRAGRGVLEDIRIGDRPQLQLSPQQATQGISLLGPDNISSRLVPDIRTRTVALADLPTPGIYTVHISAGRGVNKAGNDRISFRLNVSRDELRDPLLDPAAIKQIFGSRKYHLLEPGGQVAELFEHARFGFELWRVLLSVLILLIIIEILIGFAYTSPRRRL